MTSDSTLQKNVIDELAWDPMLENAEIGARASDGVVTLTGHVNTYAQKVAAEQAVHRVSGVKAIAEEVEVRILPLHAHTDTQLAHAAANALEWDTLVPASVQLKVQDGWITLTGDVDWDFQRRAAEHAVRSLVGVRGITNSILLKPHVSAVDIKTKIEAAFERNAQIDANRVHVSTTDGSVWLSGTVHSWAERSDAIRAAWSAPGVHRVEDNITVGL